jgi:hypothetical protein
MTPAINDQSFMRAAIAASRAAMAAGGDLLPIGCAAVFAGSTPAVLVDGPLLQDEAVAVLREFAART